MSEAFMSSWLCIELSHNSSATWGISLPDFINSVVSICSGSGLYLCNVIASILVWVGCYHKNLG